MCGHHRIWRRWGQYSGQTDRFCDVKMYVNCLCFCKCHGLIRCNRVTMILAKKNVLDRFKRLSSFCLLKKGPQEIGFQ